LHLVAQPGLAAPALLHGGAELIALLFPPDHRDFMNRCALCAAI
jgi:hypothetical protein